MDMQAKRRVVEKLLKQTLERLGIEAEILPYNEFHGDEYMFELNINVDSSKYHKSGPNYVKGYNDHIDYIEDDLTAKLKSYGLDIPLRKLVAQQSTLRMLHQSIFSEA